MLPHVHKDAGLAKHLHEDVLIQFIDMTKCLAMGTPDDLVAHLRRFHTYVGDIDWTSLRAEDCLGCIPQSVRQEIMYAASYWLFSCWR